MLQFDNGFSVLLVDGSALLSNSTCSPLSSSSNGRSPQTTLLYNPQTFDSIFLPPSTAHGGNQQYLSSSSSSSTGCSPNQSVLYRLGGQQTQPTSLAEAPPGETVSAASLPPGTSFCFCGCGELAIAPARYASHHHMAIQPSDQTAAPGPAGNSSPTAARASRFTQSGAPAASLFSAFPVSSSAESGLGDEVAVHKRRRAEEDSLESQLSDDQKRPRLSSRNTTESSDEGEGTPDRSSSSSTAAAGASSPLGESWTKFYPPYSTYPTSNEYDQRLLNFQNEGEISDSTSIAALLDEVTRNTLGNADGRLREAAAAMLLLTSSGSSLMEEGLSELNSQEQFGSDTPDDHLDDQIDDQPYENQTPDSSSSSSASSSSSSSFIFNVDGFPSSTDAANRNSADAAASSSSSSSSASVIESRFSRPEQEAS